MPTRAEIRAEVERVMAWFAKNLRIVTMDGELVPLVLNAEQQRLLTIAVAQELSGLPVRIIVLKARKVGVSTLVEAYCYYKASRLPYRRALVCAQDADSSAVLWRITRRYYDHDPNAQPVRSGAPSQRAIEWLPPLDSSFAVRTAGVKVLQRADTIHYLHASELAFWPFASATALSVFNAVAKSSKSMVFIESTANGVGGEFYDRWIGAVEARRHAPASLDGYEPVFFSWLDHTSYQRPAPAGYSFGNQDEFETDLIAAGATPEQLYWRRRTMAEDCGGDPELFVQEYPHTPEVAFRTSGRPAIPSAVQAWHRKTISVAPTPVRIRFEWDRMRGAPRLWARKADPQSTFAWTVWEPLRYVKADDAYVLGDDVSDFCLFADITQGDLADPTNARSESDFDAAFILNRLHLRQSAALHGRFAQDLLGEQLCMAGWFFRTAWATPEINIDTTALNRMRELSYPRIYVRLKADQTPDDMLSKTPLGLYGFKTTSGNRDEMIEDWIRYNRPGDDGDTSGIIQVYDQRLLDEEASFSWVKEGSRLRRRHANGAHDDVLFSGFGTLRMHLNCPRTMVVTEPPRRPVYRRGKTPSYAVAGGVDEGPTPAEERAARRKYGLRS